MAHNLYRIYLYIVFIAMLVFAAIGLGRLLQTLFSLTPLRGAYGTTPTNTQIVQVTVFFAVSWLIAAFFGILHYWLIWRDIHNDPAAGRSAIRSFFLNFSELIDAPLAIVAAAMGVIGQLGHDPAFDLTVPAAFATTALLLLAVLELERQRSQAQDGAAMTFQRLHLYGVQLILLIILTFAWNNTAFQLGNAFIFNGQVTGTVACGGFTGCPGTNLLSLVLSTLWLVAFWIGYGLFTRNDNASLLRSILHFTSFAYGVGLILYGISRALEFGILALFNITLSATDILNNYNFVALITFGLLVTAVYALWLRISARKDSTGQAWITTIIISEAIITVLLAAAFWWGLALVFFNLFQMLAGITTGPRDWSSALALIITGLAYIPLDFNLHRRYKHDVTAADPRRGYVFAMLAGGILSTAIGGAVALYSLGTDILGSPFDNWQQVARAGTAACVAGVIILAVYFWIARRENLFSGLTKRPAIEEVSSSIQPEPEQVVSTSIVSHEMLPDIDAVLDDLLAGKITRDEAAMRIQNMMKNEE
ncbi:MAG TPA: hypothetical protein VE843_05250, partial [Ktedonobacteraceae bacterium]|nr:hypothetical protein [Ktedonobacteraceae bacterium]